jgi:hypothetical protein
MSHPEFGLAWDIEVKHETANENVEKFPTSQNMSHPEFGVTWDIEVKHETANENFEIISYESFQYVRQPFIDCLSILTHAARTRQDSKQNHMASLRVLLQNYGAAKAKIWPTHMHKIHRKSHKITTTTPQSLTCPAVCLLASSFLFLHTHTHTHTHSNRNCSSCCCWLLTVVVGFCWLLFVVWWLGPHLMPTHHSLVSFLWILMSCKVSVYSSYFCWLLFACAAFCFMYSSLSFASHTQINHHCRHQRPFIALFVAEVPGATVVRAHSSTVL